MNPSNFGPWFLGLIVISIPVVMLTEAGKSDYAWAYVWVVLLSVAFYHVPQIIATVNALQNAVKQ